MIVSKERFRLFYSNHIGMGVGWSIGEYFYKYEISIFFPFFTIWFGFGQELTDY